MIFPVTGRMKAALAEALEADLFGQIYSPPMGAGPRYPISTYKKMLEDAGILFPLQVLKLPIVSSQPLVRCPDPSIAAFATEEVQKIWGYHAEEILTALEFGFAVFEKRFEEDGQFIRYKRWISIDPEGVTIRRKDDGSFDGIETFNTSIPAFKVFLYSHRKRFENLYGNSRLNGAYRYWKLDKEAYNFQGVAMQHYAMPTIIYTYPPQGEIKVKNERGEVKEMLWSEFMRTVADSIYSKAAVGIPYTEEGSLKVEAFQVRQRDLWDFNADHEWLDRKKALAIFCPEDIAVSGQKGSYARAKAQAHWLVRAIEAIKAELANRYLLPYCVVPIVELNFGKRVPLEVSFTPEPMEALELIKQVILKLEDPNRPPLDWEGIFKAVGLPYHKPQKKGASFSFPSPSAAERYLRSELQTVLKKEKAELGISEFVPVSKEVIEVLKTMSFALAAGSVDLESAKAFVAQLAKAMAYHFKASLRRAET